MLTTRTIKTRKLLALLEKHSAKCPTTLSMVAVGIYNKKYKDVKIILEYDFPEALIPFISNDMYIPYLIGKVQEHPLNENYHNFLFIDITALYDFIDKLDQAFDNNNFLDEVE